MIYFSVEMHAHVNCTMFFRIKFFCVFHSAHCNEVLPAIFGTDTCTKSIRLILNI
jgi:hypothetical protein